MNKILKFIVKGSLSLVMAVCVVSANALAMRDEYRADREDGMGILFREYPGRTSPRKASGVWSGHTFIVTAKQYEDGEEWGETTFDGVSGWVPLSYATFVRHIDPPVQCRSNSEFVPGVYRADREDGMGLAFRLHPEIDSAKKDGGVWSGHEFTVTKTVTNGGFGFGETNFHGVGGWVCLNYATLVDPIPDDKDKIIAKLKAELAERQNEIVRLRGVIARLKNVIADLRRQLAVAGEKIAKLEREKLELQLKNSEAELQETEKQEKEVDNRIKWLNNQLSKFKF